MAKKRFGIDAATTQAISQTMQMAKEHTSKLNNTLIPINKISLDPDNPRQHKIRREELENGPSNSDPDYKIKTEEYEGLFQLSSSIQKDGLLHPITVFKDTENYKLIAGERRLFASIIAKKTQLEARVYKSKPADFDLKIIQWMENESRKDLSLYKRLLNIESILKAYKSEKNETITAKKLAELLGISRQLGQYYTSIISNEALMSEIKEGRVNTMQVARELTSLRTKTEILSALEMLSQNKILPKKPKKIKQKASSKTVGRKRQAVTLGKTKQLAVVKTLAEGVLSIDQYAKYANQFNKTDWDSLDKATQAFQKLIQFLERELGDHA